MHDKELYAKILGITAPWVVTGVELSMTENKVEVQVDCALEGLVCPECGQPAKRKDGRMRRWRHLDTCQYQTFIVAEVPRVKCAEHGVHQLRIPWAESRAHFTALFEALALEWLKEAPIEVVGKKLGLSWRAADGIMQRGVKRGLAKRAKVIPERIGVDETSFAKRHEYVTVVGELAGEEPRVLQVADGRGQEALDGFYEQYTPEELEQIEVVAMDMWKPYIESTRAHVPQAQNKICFDKFHVAQHLGTAVDKVRRTEHRALRQADGSSPLTGTKYIWLIHPRKLEEHRWSQLQALKGSARRTARAWSLKEYAMQLWDYTTRGWAKRAWDSWYSWAIRSRLEPVKQVARMVKTHLWGIVNAIVHQITNARLEGINSVIQKIKYNARGFRNRDRFRNAIYFHLGGLDLYPPSLAYFHTKGR